MFQPRRRAPYLITPYNQLREIYDAPEIDSTLYHTILSQENMVVRPNMPDAYHQTPELLNQLILLGINFGEFGWALLDVKGLDAEDTILHHAPILLKYAIKHQDLQHIVDDIVGSLFKEDVLDRMHTKLNDLLYEEDNVKLEMAYQCYHNHEYHICALILASIIDSQSIHFIIENYQNTPDMINYPAQGWQSFAKIITQNYGDYLTLTWNDTQTNDKPRLRFQKKLEKCDPDSELAAHIAYVANLSMAMMKFFSNHAWNASVLPSSINRNWLAHGMYYTFDINANDCIKLLVLLHQLLLLYRELLWVDVKQSLPNNMTGGECLSK